MSVGFALRNALKQSWHRRYLSSSCCRLESLSIPKADTESPVISTKVQSLVDQITKLTLLEVSELSQVLKKQLNLPDAPPAVSFAQAPVVAAGADEAEEYDAPKIVKSSYTVKLMKYDESKKVALIKEIKSLMEDMNLVQAKKFVESAPMAVIKSDISKEEADKIKETLEKIGAECTID